MISLPRFEQAMDDDDPITVWIGKLAGGDTHAAHLLWQRYFERLVGYARRKLDGRPRRVADEEDVALSAMHSFCRGLQAGQFHDLDDRQDLWRLLVTITARKAYGQMRSERTAKRGGGATRGESIFAGRGNNDGSLAVGWGHICGPEPTPDLAVMVAENCNRLLECLPDESLRQIARWKLEGLDHEEMAERLGCVTRTITRKLERIREIWEGMGEE